MKRLLFLALTIVSVALLACTKEQISIDNPDAGESVPLDKFTPYGGGGVSPFFITGDEIGLYMKYYNKDLNKDFIVRSNINKRYVYDDNGASETHGLFIPASLPETAYYPVQQMVDLVGYMPYTASKIVENATGEYIYSIDVSSQTDMVALDLAYSDNVKGTQVEGTTSTKREQMEFRHALSRIDVVIKDISSEFTAAEVAAMTISVTGMVRNAKLNLKDASISDRADEGPITLHVGTAGEKYAGIMIPTVADKTGREIIASVGGKTLKGPIPDTIFTNGAGWQYIFNASVGKSELDVSGVTVTPWGKGTDGTQERPITPAFTDLNFKAFVMKRYCPVGATDIFARDVEDRTEIAILTSEDIGEIMLVSSYAGLEYFTNLEKLSLMGDATGAAPAITRFNLSQNKKLKTFAVTYLGLMELDVSGNPELTTLNCTGNKITSLDVSQNLKLTTLKCGNNLIQNLDLSGNPDLLELDFYSNKLTKLEISNNNKLSSIDCSYNMLTNLDLSGKTMLLELRCGDNLLTGLSLLPSPNLTHLNCGNNTLSSLDLSNLSELLSLNCGNNQLSTLNVSNNQKMSTLICYDNKLTALDLTNQLLLTEISVGDNKLPSLNVSTNTSLERLSCSNNKLVVLDLSNHPDPSIFTFVGFQGNPGDGVSGSANPANFEVKLPLGTVIGTLPDAFPKVTAINGIYKWNYQFRDNTGTPIGLPIEVTTNYTAN